MQAEAGWLFRVASARRWGGGHVARCRALAAALRVYRPVTMALDEDDGGWSRPLSEDGLSVLQGGGLPQGSWCGSLIDGYGFSDGDARALRDIAPPLVAMDDLMSPPAAADLVINAGTEDGGYRVPALVGPRYALIDKRFRALPVPRIRDIAGHVVVTFGRFDTLDATGLALSALAILAERHDFRPQLSVVLGNASPNLAAVRESVARWPVQAVLYVDHDDMPGLLCAADLVLGAGGVSLYERLACGIPSVTLRLAENQAANIALCHGHGTTLDAGPLDGLSAEALAGTILSLAGSRDIRLSQSRSGQALVDGRGPERVAARMMRAAGLDAGPVPSELP